MSCWCQRAFPRPPPHLCKGRVRGDVLVKQLHVDRQPHVRREPLLGQPATARSSRMGARHLCTGRHMHTARSMQGAHRMEGSRRDFQGSFPCRSHARRSPSSSRGTATALPPRCCCSLCFAYMSTLADAGAYSRALMTSAVPSAPLRACQGSCLRPERRHEASKHDAGATVRTGTKGSTRHQCRRPKG